MKKFLCYDTNDAASGKINVDSRGVLKPNSTVPSTNGAAYKQLVTDGNGNTKWEDRLAYDVVELTEVIAEQRFKFDYIDEENLGELSNGSIDATQYVDLLTSEAPIRVVFDGVEYSGNLYKYRDTDATTTYFFGNKFIANDILPNTGELFCLDITYVKSIGEARVVVLCNIPGDVHTFGLSIGKTIIHPMSNYQLLPKNMRVVITAYGVGSCNATYEEMVSWFDNEVPINAWLIDNDGTREIVNRIRKTSSGTLEMYGETLNCGYRNDGTLGSVPK